MKKSEKFHGSITVVMPALNEEANLADAVRTASKAVARSFSDWEILVFNDGSSDRTGEIADALAAADPRVKAFHHSSPKNLGGVYREGILNATKEFLIMLPGDNENGDESLINVFEKAGKADIVIPYVNNPEARPLRRRLISRAFVFLVNLTSGCRLRYYNGTVLHRTEILKKNPFFNEGFGYQAEILVDLIRKGYSYLEVGVEITRKPETVSKAFRFSNFVKIAKLMTSLSSSRFHSQTHESPAAY